MDYIIITYKFHNFIHSCNQLASAGKASSEPMLVWVQDVFQIITNVAKNNTLKHFARYGRQRYESKVARIFSATFFYELEPRWQFSRFLLEAGQCLANIEIC